MAKIKIAFISDDVISTEDTPNLARLKSALDAKRIEYEIEIISAKTSAEITANTICTGNYDIAVIDEHINAIDILDHCSKHPSEKKPRSIFVDGNITEIINTAFSHTHFSGSVGVFKGDEVILMSGYQNANRLADHAVQNNSETIFNIASMNKMMTGLAITILAQELTITMLAQEKEFSFHEPIITFLPPNYPHRHLFEDFTLHELLTHTSGLGGGIPEGEAFGALMPNVQSIEQFIPMFFPGNKTPPIENRSTRGENHYSNAGYCLLGLFIEAMTGNYYKFIQERILLPAGMTHTVPQRDTTALTYAIPYVGVPKCDLTKKPEFFAQLNDASIHPELLKLVQRAENLFEVAQQFTREQHSKVNALIAEYEKGLATTTNFPEFKANFLSKLDAIHHEFFQLESSGRFKYKYYENAKEVELLYHEIKSYLEKNPQSEPANSMMAQLKKLLEPEGLHANFTYPTAVIDALTINLSRAHPAGCWYSNIDDFRAFQQALWNPNGKFSEFSETLTTNTVPRDTSKPELGKYAYGFDVNEEKGIQSVSHGGSAPGVRSNFSTYPESGYTFITFSNDDSSAMNVAYATERFLARNNFQNAATQIQFLDPRVSQSPDPFSSMVENIAYISEIKGKSTAMSSVGLHAQPSSKQEEKVVAIEPDAKKFTQ